MNGPAAGGARAVILLGGLFLRFGPVRERPGLRAVTQEPSSGNWEAADSNEEQATEPGNRRRRDAPGASAALPGTLRPLVAGTPQTAPSKSSISFPTAREITAGMERSALLRRYGPSLTHTSSLEHGVPMEALVYLEREPERATFILLRVGRIVSATTSGH